MVDKRIFHTLSWIGWLALLVLSFVSSILIVSVAVQLLSRSQPVSTTMILVQSIVIYALTLFIMLGLAMLIKRPIGRRELGITWLKWRDIGIAMASFVVYLIVGSLVISVVQKVIPNFPADQAQDLGFTSVYGGERLLAFVTLVIVAPIIEELLFRGLLYGKMRKSGVNIVLSTLTVSLLFGLAHGQLNVGIDVFILSIILCLVREYTDSIGASILIHMMKNAVAFYVLFIAADTLSK